VSRQSLFIVALIAVVLVVVVSYLEMHPVCGCTPPHDVSSSTPVAVRPAP